MVHHAEYGSGRADSQRQRQNRRQCENWIAPQAARAITQILQQTLEPRQASLIPPALLRLIDSAETPAGGLPCFRRRHPAAQIVLLEHFEVAADFVIEVVRRVALPAEKAEQAGEQFENVSHHSASPDSPRSSLAITPAIRSQSSASTASCLRPALVSS